VSAQLDGIFPALVTPLTPSNTVNTAALERLMGHVFSAGAHGVYLCGSTGEGMSLPASERRKVVETAMRVAPAGKRIVVHVGASSQTEALELARHANDLGVTAISSLPPSGVSYPELLQYYRALTTVVDVPLLAYYFPELTGATLSADQLLEICRIPGVGGIKFTDYDLYALSLLARNGNSVFNGRDEVLCAGLLMGAAGGIGSIYNVAPQWFVGLYSNARAGRWAEARRLQDSVNDLIRVLLAYPLVPAIKRVLSWNGIDCGHAIKPPGALTPLQELQLRAALEPMELRLTV
jgi:N-acetylneuraminate lyase